MSIGTNIDTEQTVDEVVISDRDEKNTQTVKRESKFASLVNRFSAWIYRLFILGLFGRCFTAYNSATRKFSDGLICSAFGRDGRISKFFARSRYHISRSIENSRILGSLNSSVSSWLSVNLSVYGIFVMIFGGLSAVFGILLGSFEGTDILTSERVIFGAVAVISSFVLMASSKTLAEALGQSRITKKVLVGFFGISEDRFKTDKKATGGSLPIAIILAITLGSLTYIISPTEMFGAFLALLMGYLVIKYPEVGVVTTLFAIPFVDVIDREGRGLVLVALVTVISYFIKLLCGRRRLKIELIDVYVILFGAIVAFGGFASTGGTAASKEAAIMVCFMLEYVVVVNVIRSELWLKRCMTALIASVSVVAVLCLFDFLSGYVDFMAYIAQFIPFLNDFAETMFLNADGFSAYMVMLFPIFLSALFSQKRAIRRFGLFICLAAALFAVVYMDSKAAWIGIVVAFLVFMLFYSHKTLTTVLFGALPIVCIISFIPPEVRASIFDFLKVSDMSVTSRLAVWRGGIEMISDNLISGIGVGRAAFLETYPMYAESGFEAAGSLYSVFLQIISSLGIVGLLVFLILIFTYIQKTFCFMRYRGNDAARLSTLACLCCIIAVTVMGLAYDIFADDRVFMGFWMIMALGCAHIRVGDEDYDRSISSQQPSERSADLTIDIRA